MHTQIDKESGPSSTTEATQFHQAQAGCTSSLNALMAYHDGLVQTIVRQQVLGGLPFGRLRAGSFIEALQAGRVGLWRAIQGFDPTRGLAFSTYAWLHWFDFEPYLVELHDFLAEYGTWLATTEPDGQDLRDRLARLVDGCTETLTTTDVNPGREAMPLSLCRVDPNLANVVWNENGKLRWVDWEFSGWGDPALDLAELRWHVPLAGIPQARAWQRAQAQLRENYARPSDDPAFDDRIAVWDCLLSVRWPFLILRWLWSLHNGPDRPRLSQIPADPAQLRARFARTIERVERFADGKSLD